MAKPDIEEATRHFIHSIGCHTMIDAEVIDQAIRAAIDEMKSHKARGITNEDFLMHASISRFFIKLTLDVGDTTAVEIMKALFDYAGLRGRPT
jgi:hypothetical protein